MPARRLEPVAQYRADRVHQQYDDGRERPVPHPEQHHQQQAGRDQHRVEHRIGLHARALEEKLPRQRLATRRARGVALARREPRRALGELPFKKRARRLRSHALVRAAP